MKVPKKNYKQEKTIDTPEMSPDPTPAAWQ
jgi:hypothetical protein